MQWPQFFADMLQIVQLGHVWTVDLYLRVLMAIDSEVVDRHIIHTQEVCAYIIICNAYMYIKYYIQLKACITDVVCTANSLYRMNTVEPPTMDSPYYRNNADKRLWYRIVPYSLLYLYIAASVYQKPPYSKL